MGVEEVADSLGSHESNYSDFDSHSHNKAVVCVQLLACTLFSYVQTQVWARDIVCCVADSPTE